MARTERVAIRATVKENTDGIPFLYFERTSPPMPTFGPVNWGFELRLGTTLEEAEALASHINQHVQGLFALTMS